MAEHLVVRLGRDGDGVVEGPRGTVFVRGALPGDRIHLGKVRKDGSIVRADLAELVAPGPDRVASACGLALRCGGCPLMAASETLEAGFKRDLVAQALAAGGFEGEVELERPGPHLGYRQRARLAFVGTQRGAVIGHRAPGANAVIDTPSCAVLAPALDAALAWARVALASLAGSGELHLGSTARGPAIGITTEAAQPPAVYRALEDAVQQGTLGGAWIRAFGTKAVRFGEASEVARDVDGRALSFPMGGFRQAHEAAPQRLGEAVLALGAPEGKRVLELHAGHGSFSLALAARAAGLTAVELDAEASAALRGNLAAHGLSAEVKAEDAARHLARLDGGTRRRLELVVLDPPRTGARELVPALSTLRAELVYVSCDPRTLGRDLGLLRESGWRVDGARAFDLFPRTAHVETVCRLRRAVSD
jgi:23S rRNA (uracil1939-C5)-methyltransferase